MRDLFIQEQRCPWNSHNCSTLCFSWLVRLTLFFSGALLRSMLWFYCVLLGSVSCVLYGILDTRNIDLSFWDLLVPLMLIVEPDINCITFSSTLITYMLHMHINSLTLTHKAPQKNLLKGRKPRGGRHYIFQRCVNLSKWTSKVSTFPLRL